MLHTTSKTHENILHGVLGQVAQSGSAMEWDVRASLRTKHVNAQIELITNARSGESIDPVSGIARLKNEVPIHPSWRIGRFKIAPHESLSPTYEYLNGKQLVAADGVLSGHAHLHVALLRDWPDVVRASSGVVGVEMPASYEFVGGHDWYTDRKDDDGNIVLRAKIFKNVVPNELYMMRLDLVHVDDAMISPALHGQPVNSLTTVFQLV